MSIRVCALIAMTSWSLAALGCGADDTAGDGPAHSTHAASDNKTPTPEEVIAGACGMQEYLGKCQGAAEFTICSLETCGGEMCRDGACKEYTACLEAAEDPCTDCTPSKACDDCMAEALPCVLDTCVAMLAPCSN